MIASSFQRNGTDLTEEEWINCGTCLLVMNLILVIVIKKDTDERHDYQ